MFNQAIGTEKLRIASYHTDIHGKASLPALAGMFQEIAGNHARENGFGYEQMLKTGKIWVLTRLKIKVNELPAWGDIIELNTWIVNREKFFSRRDFELFNQNKEIPVAASSGWMLIDVKTKRPQHVDRLKMEIPVLPDKLAINESLNKINGIEIVENSSNYQVKYSDLDINYHVNNTQYIKIFLDAVPFERMKTGKIKSMEINYLSESSIGDELEILTGTGKEQGNKTIIQEIQRLHDGKIICRAKTEWE